MEALATMETLNSSGLRANIDCSVPGQRLGKAGNATEPE